MANICYRLVDKVVHFSQFLKHTCKQIYFITSIIAGAVLYNVEVFVNYYVDGNCFMWCVYPYFKLLRKVCISSRDSINVVSITVSAAGGWRARPRRRRGRLTIKCLTVRCSNNTHFLLCIDDARVLHKEFSYTLLFLVRLRQYSDIHAQFRDLAF